MKRIERLEFLQRESEFKSLATVLDHYEDLTEAQNEAHNEEFMPRLIRLFEAERLAGVPLEESLEKLPEAFKKAVYRSMANSLDQEAPLGPETKAS